MFLYAVSFWDRALRNWYISMSMYCSPESLSKWDCGRCKLVAEGLLGTVGQPITPVYQLEPPAVSTGCMHCVQCMHAHCMHGQRHCSSMDTVCMNSACDGASITGRVHCARSLLVHCLADLCRLCAYLHLVCWPPRAHSLCAGPLCAGPVYRGPVYRGIT